ncbi:MAG: hypothetical protein P9M12_04875 [Candidatus Aceula lacicola]|nr:hypothetical protein [Candidatus Aceula lacicola]
MIITTKKYFFIVFLLILCVSQTGCALLKLPLDLLGGLFGILKQVPMPPPWVFL